MSYSINQIDISGAEFLSQEAARRHAEGGGLYLYRTKDHVQAFLRRGSYMKAIGEENLFTKKGQAITAIYQKLDKSICAQCSRNIFFECHSADATTTTTTVAAEPPQSLQNERPAASYPVRTPPTTATGKVVP